MHLTSALLCFSPLPCCVVHRLPTELPFALRARVAGHMLRDILHQLPLIKALDQQDQQAALAVAQQAQAVAQQAQAPAQVQAQPQSHPTKGDQSSLTTAAAAQKPPEARHPFSRCSVDAAHRNLAAGSVPLGPASYSMNTATASGGGCRQLPKLIDLMAAHLEPVEIAPGGCVQHAKHAEYSDNAWQSCNMLCLELNTHLYQLCLSMGVTCGYSGDVG